jgi:hypothetical protein
LDQRTPRILPVVGTADETVKDLKVRTIAVDLENGAKIIAAALLGHSVEICAGLDQVAPRSCSVIITAGEVVQNPVILREGGQAGE